MRGNSGFIWKWSIVCPLKGISMSSLSSLTQNSVGLKQKRISEMCTNLFVIFIFFGLISSTCAGPVYSRHRRMMREVFSDLSVEPQNSTQPDGKCLLDGLQVSQASVVCEKKNGCRAIQKTGYCCPDYHCECELDGKIYENGAKLAVDPGTPCKVCYCQGGKILCNSVTCYNRNDCEPKYIPGRCCPEYDNCPPLDELPSSTSAKPTSNQYKLVPSLGIKIKEITKPEEIRIVDEKPKVIYPTPKPNGSSDSNQSKALQIEQISSTTENLSAIENIETNSDKNVNVLENTNANDTTNDEDSLKIVRHVEHENEKSETISSTSEAQRLGEEVVIVDRNGQTKPILILGVEGLQRGDTVEEPVHVDDKMEEAMNENLKSENSSILVTDSDLEPEAAGSEINVHVVSKASHEIINKITTEGIVEDSVSSSTSKQVYETILYTPSSETSEEKEVTRTIFETVYHQQSKIPLNVSTENPSSPAVFSDVVPSPNEHHHLHLDDDDTTPIETNPAYPTIPGDDLSIYRREVLEKNDDYPENSHKSKSALQTEESKSFSEKFTTEGPSISSVSSLETFRLQNPSTENAENIEDDSIYSKYGQERSPGEPFLIPEWERNSTESIVQNETDSSDEEWRNQAVIEVDPGSGSGLGQSLEGASSPQPTNIIDIDDKIEASADGTPISIALSTGTSHEDVVEDRAISSIFDPDNQLANMKFQKVVEAFHNFKKSYLNIF